MKKLFLTIVSTVIFAANTSAFDFAAAKTSWLPAETRCGWFVNPTPAHAWLIDAKSQWIIGIQGGDQAEGDWPSFPNARWIKTNGNYGYGCACMRVTTNRADERIVTIHSASSRPLSTCRKDKALKGKEPRD